jgi:hypothetical protein
VILADAIRGRKRKKMTDGDAEMDQLEEDLVDPGRNKVKKEDS